MPYLRTTYASFGGPFAAPREFDLRPIASDFLTLKNRVGVSFTAIKIANGNEYNNLKSSTGIIFSLSYTSHTW